MVLRILPLILFLAACTSSPSSDAAATEAEQPQEKGMQKAESSAELANNIVKLLSKATTLTAEQQSAIQNAVATVPLNSLQSDEDQRIMIRQKIISEVLTAEQMAAWQAYRKQQNRAPVIIE